MINLADNCSEVLFSAADIEKRIKQVAEEIYRNVPFVGILKESVYKEIEN